MATRNADKIELLHMPVSLAIVRAHLYVQEHLPHLGGRPGAERVVQGLQVEEGAAIFGILLSAWLLRCGSGSVG
jgi:hypothetical protein